MLHFTKHPKPKILLWDIKFTVPTTSQLPTHKYANEYGHIDTGGQQ